jgi:hypothetical protein
MFGMAVPGSMDWGHGDPRDQVLRVVRHLAGDDVVARAAAVRGERHASALRVTAFHVPISRVPRCLTARFAQEDCRDESQARAHDPQYLDPRNASVRVRSTMPYEKRPHASSAARAMKRRRSMFVSPSPAGA